MPSKLSEKPEESVRQFVVDNIRTSKIENYDPNQTDPQATDFLPVTSNWSKWGDHYPAIFVGEQNGPTIPNAGQTNYNGVQGDGSGPNQYNIKNITVSTQAVEEGSYLNSTDADDLTFELYQEIKHQIQNNATTAITDALFAGITPPTQSKNQEETDQGSTLTWIQQQGTIVVGYLDTP